MNILWLELESLLPATTGGRIGSLKRLQQIAKTENIYLFYPYDSDDDLSYVGELEKLCKEVHPYSRRQNWMKALLHLYQYPFTVASRCISEMKQDIAKCLQKNHIDLINVEYPHMCVVLFDLEINVPIVLNQFNVEWRIYRDISKGSKNILKKCAYWLDSFRLIYYEKQILRKLSLSCVTYLSNEDMQYMTNHGYYDEKICRWVPLGGDVVEEYSNVTALGPGQSMLVVKKGTEKAIVFTGKMSYRPNVDAAKWFANEIFPLILKEISAVKFYIVGKEPPEEVKQLTSEHVIVTGFVEDPDAYLKMADLVVLPLRYGGGVKVKLLQAISYRKLIVSTSKGVEGISYSDGKTIPVADNADEFAYLCIDALKNPETARSRQCQAYDIFLQNYTWDIIGKKYLQLLKEAAEIQ